MNNIVHSNIDPENDKFNHNDHRPSAVARQGRVFAFLERPVGWKCHAYHIFVFLLIVTGFTLTIWSYVIVAPVLLYVESIFLAFFIGEYLIRIWSAGCKYQYAFPMGRLRFICKPMCLIELIAIVSSVALLIFGTDGTRLKSSAVRGFQFVHLMQLLRIDRQCGSWRLLGSVVYMHRNELVTTVYISVLGLIFGSYFVFLAEKDVKLPGNDIPFKTYADAMWWGVVTFFTIGFGDMVPRTWIGKAITCISALALVAFFQLPAGILGSGFALKVHQNHRQKHFNRQIPAAAILIQRLWECYSLAKNAKCSATWKKFDRKYNRTNDTTNHFVINEHNSSFIYNTPTEPDSTREATILKNVALAVCKMKYLVACRKFQKLRELYDVRDIIEQYSQGHLNMMLKIKSIQRKIEQCIGKPNQSDEQMGQPITVNSRLTQLENQVALLYRKLEDCEKIIEDINCILNTSSQKVQQKKSAKAKSKAAEASKKQKLSSQKSV
ncbi:Potassium voltage-gated channel subfamily KQT member 1 [Trichinella sp. T6]|nr:Potassium voltage-gated channel subfamily KQT member 1 [Trichinella sp. T6]KRX73192.1 Potassium voltage-gated channel subfamily KQT member 1 [Trichinella sp. T6]